MSKFVLPVLGALLLASGAYWFVFGVPTRPDVSPFAQSEQVSTATTTPRATTNPEQQATGQGTLNTINSTNTQPTMPTSATLHTNKGDIVIQFDPASGPTAVKSFIELAQKGFYDGTKFHRVIKDFMIQGGDPLTKNDSQMARWGTGGPGYTFPDEVGPNNSNVLGSVAMANSGPNTNGSQFFINAKDNHFLDQGYTVWAHVTKGLDIVKLINSVPTDKADRPISPVVLEKVTLQ